jgi:hypothetical protein
MAAAPLIAIVTAIPLPERVSEIEFARIGRRADHGAGNRADRGTRTGVAGECSNCGTAARTDQSTGHSALTRIGAATGKEKGRNNNRPGN